MKGGWSASEWEGFSDEKVKGKAIEEVYTSRSMPEGFDPKTIKVRESRDSAMYPNSTPVILALDVTGSMEPVLEQLMKKGLNKLIEEILKRKSISDPHFMAMAVGDAYRSGSHQDQAPLQVTQFEADIRIAEQLIKLWPEGGGGANPFESYNLPWYFAARKTEIDSLAKRGEKGILLTFGDEECPPELKKEHIERIFGDKVQGDISNADLLAMVQQKYDVFHVVIEQGNSISRYGNRDNVYNSWKSVLPQGHVIPLKDIKDIGEVVAAVIDVHKGKDPKAVIRSYDDKSTAIVVAEAIKDMNSPLAKTGGDGPWRPGKKSGGGGRSGGR